MDKVTALQTFKSHVDVPGVLNDFPNLDFFVTELDDGQQEIVIRLQGADPDFYPSEDIAVIDALGIADVSMFSVKNTITLEKEKRIRKQELRSLRDHAIFKRIKQMLLDAGLNPRKALKIVKDRLAVEDI